MLAQERQKIILEMLSQQRIIKTLDIAKKFGISNLTARRDLDVLREQGFVSRVYGGAVLIQNVVSKPVTEEKNIALNVLQKKEEAIGRIAASMVEVGDTVFLGNGRFTLGVAKNLLNISGLIFVTSSMTIASLLLESNNQIYMLGGLIDPYEQNIYSYSAMKMMENFYPNKTFIGCGGITAKHGITADHQQGAELGAIAVKNAAKAIVVADSSKFGTDYLNKVCSLSDLHAIITDNELAPEYREEMEQAGIPMYYAEA